MKKTKSKTKYLLIFFSLLILLFLFFMKKSGKNNLLTNFISYTISPLQKIVYQTSYNANYWVKTTFKGKELQQKNTNLQIEINNLRKQLVEFNKYKIQNQELIKLLNTKDSYNSLQVKPSLVIGKIPNDPFKSFIIDKGKNDNIKIFDPIITPEGLIGYIDKVYSTTSIVKTILDKDISIGVYNTNNGESGILTGTTNLAYKNLTKMKYISRQSSTKTDDILITSDASNNLPTGILVGKIINLKQEPHNTSYFGVVEPFCNFNDLKHIFIVTSFIKTDIKDFNMSNNVIGQSVSIGISN